MPALGSRGGRNRQALWRELVVDSWPVEGISPAFAAMGVVCWRARYQLLFLEHRKPVPADLVSVRTLLERINAEFAFFMVLRVGGTAIVSRARLDTWNTEATESGEADNDELLELGTDIYADELEEAEVGALDFANHAPFVECFVKRADGKVATLFKLASEEPWELEPSEDGSTDYSGTVDSTHDPGSTELDRASPGWLIQALRERMEDEGKLVDGGELSVEFTLESCPKCPHSGAHPRAHRRVLIASLSRAMPPPDEGYIAIGVHEMHKILRENVVWV